MASVLRNYRGAALARLFQIVTLIYGSGTRLTQQDLATACECSIRQIGRDLLALRLAGVPLHPDPKRGYYLDDEWSPFHLTFTLQEAMALLLARQSMTAQAHMPFAHSAQTAFDKITALLPASLQKQLEADETVAYYGGGKRDYSSAPMGRLVAAIRKHERLEMRYYTIRTDKVSDRQVDPYQVGWFNGYGQLIGYCHTRARVINFALDGIRALEITGQNFSIPQTFSLAKYLEGVSGPMLGTPVEIEVRFSPELARYARRRTWRFPHTLQDEPDDAVLLKGTVSGLDDIRKELLTWGRHAYVIQPPELREAIHAEARAVVALYASQKPD